MSWSSRSRSARTRRKSRSARSSPGSSPGNLSNISPPLGHFGVKTPLKGGLLPPLNGRGGHTLPPLKRSESGRGVLVGEKTPLPVRRRSSALALPLPAGPSGSAGESASDQDADPEPDQAPDQDQDPDPDQDPEAGQEYDDEDYHHEDDPEDEPEPADFVLEIERIADMEPIVLLAPSGAVTYASPSACLLFGVSPADAVGQPLTAFVRSVTTSQMETRFMGLLSGQRDVVTVQHSNGRAVYAFSELAQGATAEYALRLDAKLGLRGFTGDDPNAEQARNALPTGTLDAADGLPADTDEGFVNNPPRGLGVARSAHAERYKAIANIVAAFHLPALVARLAGMARLVHGTLLATFASIVFVFFVVAGQYTSSLDAYEALVSSAQLAVHISTEAAQLARGCAVSGSGSTGFELSHTLHQQLSWLFADVDGDVQDMFALHYVSVCDEPSFCQPRPLWELLQHFTLVAHDLDYADESQFFALNNSATVHAALDDLMAGLHELQLERQRSIGDAMTAMHIGVSLLCAFFLLVAMLPLLLRISRRRTEMFQFFVRLPHAARVEMLALSSNREAATKTMSEQAGGEDVDDVGRASDVEEEDDDDSGFSDSGQDDDSDDDEFVTAGDSDQSTPQLADQRRTLGEDLRDVIGGFQEFRPMTDDELRGRKARHSAGSSALSAAAESVASVSSGTSALFATRQVAYDELRTLHTKVSHVLRLVVHPVMPVLMCVLFVMVSYLVHRELTDVSDTPARILVAARAVPQALRLREAAAAHVFANGSDAAAAALLEDSHAQLRRAHHGLLYGSSELGIEHALSDLSDAEQRLLFDAPQCLRFDGACRNATSPLGAVAAAGLDALLESYEHAAQHVLLTAESGEHFDVLWELGPHDVVDGFTRWRRALLASVSDEQDADIGMSALVLVVYVAASMIVYRRLTRTILHSLSREWRLITALLASVPSRHKVVKTVRRLAPRGYVG